MIGKDDKEFLVVKSETGDSEDRYKIMETVRGGQSSIIKGRLLQPDGTISEKDLALRYGNGSAEVDKVYGDIYLRAPVEVQRCMPRSYGVVKGRSGESYAVQEWVEGRGLRDELKEKSVLPPEDAKVILEELGRLLVHLHSQEGYLHRDIKPDNLIVHRDGSGKIDRVVLTDWDLIREVRSQPRSEGTPGYAPWQQHYPAESLWPVIDEYALGMTLLELMTGQEVAGETVNPFRAPVEDYLNSANLPQVWNEIILGLTSVDQEKRLNARRALELLDKS